MNFEELSPLQEYLARLTWRALEPLFLTSVNEADCIFRGDMIASLAKSYAAEHALHLRRVQEVAAWRATSKPGPRR